MIALPNPKGFTFRIMVLLLALELVSLSLWGIWSYSHSRQALLHSMTQRMTEVSAHARYRLAQFYDTIVFRVQHSGEMLDMVAAPSIQNFPRILLSQILVDHPEVVSLSLVDVNSREIERLSRLYAYGPNDRRDLSDDPRVAMAMEGQTYVGKVTWSLYAKPQVELVIPMMNGLAKPQFVMLLILNLQSLWNTLEQLHLNTSGYVYVVDADLRLLAHPDPSLVLRTASLAGTSVENLLFQLHGDSQLHRYRNIQGQDVIGLSVFDPATDWWLVVEQPASDALAPLRQLMFEFLGALAMVLLLTVLAMYYLSRLTLRPLSALQQAVGRMAAGERNIHIKVPDIVELRNLASAFNSMAWELERAMDALKQSEARMARFFEAASEVAFIHDKGTILDINPAVTTLFGYTPDEVIGRKIRDFTAPESQQRLLEAIESQEDKPYELEGICKNGSRVTVEVRARSIERGGRRIQVVTLHDTTMLNNYRRKAERAADELLQLIETANAPIFGIDLQGRISEWNRKVAGLTGFSKEEVLHRELVAELIAEDYRASVQAVLTRALQGKQTDNYELTLYSKDGKRLLLLLNATARSDMAGRITGVVGVGQDITKRKQVETALQKLNDELEERVVERTSQLLDANNRLLEMDQLKSMFIASMSHELRTPLNSIIGFSGILLQGMDGELNAQQSDHLGRVKRSARHLLTLITDVIDISKVEAGKVDAYAEKFMLHEVVDEAVSGLRMEIENKGLELEVDVPTALEMNTDRKRLLQCLLNYVSNASKFTETGKIAISVREEDAMVVVTVKDSGIGIREQDMPRLYAQFTRFDSPLVRKTLGTGLGLYLTRKLTMEVLQGEVFAESTYGRGSSFSIRIPKRIEPVEDGGKKV